MKTRILPTIKILLTAAIFYFIFANINIHKLLTYNKQIDLFWLLSIFLVFLAARIVLAFSNKQLLDSMGISYSFTKILAINFSSMFLSLIGELAGAFIRFKRIAGNAKQYQHAIIFILVERLSQITVMTFLALVTGFFIVKPEYNRYEQRTLIALSAGMGISALTGVMILFTRIPYKLTSYIQERFAFRSTYFHKTTSTLKQLLHALADKKITSLILLLLYIVYTLINVFTGWLIFTHLGISLPLLTCTWILLIAGISSMIPVTFMGLGIREGVLVVLLGKYGVAQEFGLIIGMLYFAFSVFEGLIGGCLELVRYSRAFCDRK